MNAEDPTPTIKRAIGYVRVSSVGGRSGPGYHTLDVQKASIKRVCELRGYELLHIYTEEDWSGADATRPEFNEVMDRVIERDEADAVAVWKVSRFSRSWAHSAEQFKRLTDHGKDLLSGEEGFDTSQATGRLMMQLLFSLADWEREVLAAQFVTIKERVIDRGSHLGRVPVGYMKVRDKPRGDGDVSIPQARAILRKLGSAREPVHGSLVPDPRGAPVVRRAYEMRLDGASISAIRAMMDTELPRPEGGLWMSVQVVRLLTLRTYLGEVTQNGAKFRRENHEAHEPIVPVDLFNAVALAAPAKIKRSLAAAFPLSGRVYCAACSYTMAGGQPTHKVKVWRSTGERVGRGTRTDRTVDEVVLHDEALRVYRCPGRRGVGRCPEPSSILADTLEDLVRERAAALEALVAEVADDGTQDPRIAELGHEIDRLANMLDRMMRSDVEVDDLWQEQLVRMQQDRLRLTRERERLVAADRRRAIDIVQWSGLTDDEQLEVLRDSIHGVFVRRLDRGAPAGDRIHIVWAGDADAPPVGGRANRIPPTRFVFPDRD